MTGRRAERPARTANRGAASRGATVRQPAAGQAKLTAPNGATVTVDAGLAADLIRRGYVRGQR